MDENRQSHEDSDKSGGSNGLATFVFAGLVGGVVVFSALLALAGAWVVARSEIDVGVDVSTPVDDGPFLAFGQSSKDDTRIAMARVPDRFSIKWSFFEVTATGKKNPKATRGRAISEVWVENIAGHSGLTRIPPDTWKRRGRDLYTQYVRKQPCTLRWEGYEAKPALTLLRHPPSGIVKVRTPAGEETIDLYSPTRRHKRIKVPAKPLARYHARVPRRALAGLTLEVGARERADVARVYIGSMIPTVHFSGRRFPRDIWGRVHENSLARRQDGRYVFGAVSPWEAGGRKTFAVLFVAFLALTPVALLLVWWAWRLLRHLLTRPARARALTPLRPRNAVWPLLLSLPSLALWLFLLACYFPGPMSNDSVDQWNQAHTLEMKDEHPVFHTLTIAAAVRVWDSPASMAALQVLMLSFALGWGLSVLLRAGVRWWVVAPALILSVTSISTGMLAIILWKDAMYTAVVSLFTVAVTICVLDKPGNRRWGRWVGVGVLLGLCPLYRHNGLVILLGMTPLLIVFFFERWKRALLAVAVAYALFFGVTRGLYPALKVAPGKLMEFHTDRATLLVSQDAPLSPEECEFLDDVGPFFRKRRFQWFSHRRYSVIFYYRDTAFVAENLGAYRRMHASWATRYPLLFLWQTGRRNLYLVWPPRRGADPLNMSYYNSICPLGKRHGLTMAPIFPKWRAWFNKQLRKSVRSQYIWFTWRPGLYLWIVLVALAATTIRAPEPRLLLPFAPVLLNTTGLALVATSQNSRYQFPLTFACWFLVCLAFLPRQKPPARRRRAVCRTPGETRRPPPADTKVSAEDEDEDGRGGG